MPHGDMTGFVYRLLPVNDIALSRFTPPYRRGGERVK